nr:dual specificity protein phosphatase family protein [Cupriavidus pauculus]
MKQHLSDVISALHRPPTNGVRRAFALSRAEAERLPSLPTFAIISITTPGRPPAALNDVPNLLRLNFSDVDFLNNELSPRARVKLSEAFTAQQAEEVRRFVESLPGDVRTVVVHCEGGYSRSCAIALALHRLYGYEVEIDRLIDANPSILSLMMSKAPPIKHRR